MNHSQLSLDQAPSIATPLRYFATAPVFLIIASLLMLYTGPEILQNRWLPQTLALTHSITLGFISMVIIGALFQILPVLAGCNIPYANHLSLIIYLLLLAGIFLLITGFIFSNPLLHKLSMFTLIPALAIFLISISISLFSSSSKIASAKGIKLSISAFWITLAFALILFLSYAWPTYPLLRQYTELHISWALLGWVFLSIVAVAYQVIPMFQVTNEYPEMLKRYFSPAIIIILILFSIIRYYEINYNRDLGWLITSISHLCGCLILIFVFSSIHLLLQRKKRLADYSLWFWISGLSCLSLSILLYLVSTYSDFDFNITIAILFLAGFASAIITGMLIKIIPFLIWFHLHRNINTSMTNSARPPSMTEIIDYKKGRLLFIFYFSSVLFTLLSIPLPTLFFYPAALLCMAYGCYFFVLIIQSIQTYSTFNPTD